MKNTKIPDEQRYINPNLLYNGTAEEFYAEETDFHTVDIPLHLEQFNPTINFDENNCFGLPVPADDEDESKLTIAEDNWNQAVIHSDKHMPAYFSVRVNQAQANETVEAKKTSICSSAVKAYHYATVGLTNTVFTIFNSVKNNIPANLTITRAMELGSSDELREIEDNTYHDDPANPNYQNSLGRN